MKPRDPLMIEHRLIEKMLAVVRNKISEFKKMGMVGLVRPQLSNKEVFIL